MSSLLDCRGLFQTARKRFEKSASAPPREHAALLKLYVQEKWLALFLLSSKDGKPRDKDDKPINISVVIDVRSRRIVKCNNKKTQFHCTISDLGFNGGTPLGAGERGASYVTGGASPLATSIAIPLQKKNAQRAQESNCLRDTDYIAVSTFNTEGHEIHPLMQVC